MEDPRESIRTCACELYLTEGLRGLSMRKLAKEVGVTAPALYRYYDGREAVLADLVRQAYRVFLGYLHRGLEASTPYERFASAVNGYLDFALAHPRWYAIMFSGPERLGMESIPEDIEVMGSTMHQFWNDRVIECMRSGVLREGDPNDVSLTFWAHAHGILQLYHQGRLNTDEAGFRRLVLESNQRLFQGIMTEEFAAELAAKERQERDATMATGVARRTGT